ncbi:hypothetical protein [Blastococcus colisei]|uniref:hypothetical protein n=1 Tax=Blastococcus colisei TaxID=1564162 RepID=UPI0011548206|nr:hypothetical protein [Blastococcus colisei]
MSKYIKYVKYALVPQGLQHVHYLKGATRPSGGNDPRGAIGRAVLQDCGARRCEQRVSFFAATQDVPADWHGLRAALHRVAWVDARTAELQPRQRAGVDLGPRLQISLPA